MATGSKLPTLIGQEFVSRYIIRKIKVIIITHQHCWPDEGMKRNIILTNKIIALCLLIFLPKGPPPVFVPTGLSPLLSCGEVADDSLKPHIDAFIFKAINRHRYSPIYIASDSSIPEPLLQIAHSKVKDILSPVGLLFHPS